jgi:hypothetical protein
MNSQSSNCLAFGEKYQHAAIYIKFKAIKFIYKLYLIEFYHRSKNQLNFKIKKIKTLTIVLHSVNVYLSVRDMFLSTLCFIPKGYPGGMQMRHFFTTAGYNLLEREIR